MLHFSPMDEQEGATTEYLSSLVASLQHIRKRIRERTEESEKWSERIELAVSQGREDLADAARARAQEAEDHLQELRREETERVSEAKELREEMVAPGSGMDPELQTPSLLRALDAFISGDDTGEQEQIHREQALRDAGEELERLKREEQSEEHSKEGH
jgi:hypothetical protein